MKAGLQEDSPMSMNGMLERNTTLQVYTEMESEGRKDFTGGKITEYSKR